MAAAQAAGVAHEGAAGPMLRRWLGLATVLVACLAAAGACTAREEATVAELQARLLSQIKADAWETRGYTGRGVLSERVMDAMAEVPRHQFVDRYGPAAAYANRPLPIGHGQTISQPYIVALMTDLLDPEADHVVLEIGTGSGYQAAVLAALVSRVYSIEIIPELAETAERRLARLGIENVAVKTGDGYFGWPEAGPFDGIIVTRSRPGHPPGAGRAAKTGRAHGAAGGHPVHGPEPHRGDPPRRRRHRPGAGAAGRLRAADRGSLTGNCQRLN